MERPGVTDLILFNTNGTGINIQGLVTNGNKAYISYTPTTIINFALQNGKQISYNGTQIYSSANITSLAQTVSIPITPSQSIKGDLNNDTKVDSNDVILLMVKWLNITNITNEDLNTDSKVDAKDLGIMMSNWR